MLSSKSSKSKVGFIKWNAITASEGRFYVSGSVTRACVFRHARMRDVRDATPPASKEAGQVAETGGGRQRYESYLSRQEWSGIHAGSTTSALPRDVRATSGGKNVLPLAVHASAAISSCACGRGYVDGDFFSEWSAGLSPRFGLQPEFFRPEPRAAALPLRPEKRESEARRQGPEVGPWPEAKGYSPSHQGLQPDGREAARGGGPRAVDPRPGAAG